MGTLEKVLLGSLLAAFASFPIALFLYLRTAYREARWRGVKEALAVFGVVLAVWVAVQLFQRHLQDLIGRVIEHPFGLGTILLIVFSWLLHHSIKARLDEHS